MKNNRAVLILIIFTFLLFNFCNINEEQVIEDTNNSPNNNTDNNAEFTIAQTLSDEAQKNTIAFDGLAFLTGDLCSDSFYPPGKVADFFGFQYLRDNDSDRMGHNTDFLSKAADNVLFKLSDSQLQQLIDLAYEQVEQINGYAYKRFPLMKAFRRLLENDLPVGKSELNLDAVKEYSAEIYKIDGEMSYRRAQVIGNIINSLDNDQREYFDAMVSTGMLSWPDAEPKIDKRDYDHDVHVAIMTFASQLYSWYKGNNEADVYFCPERHGTYFGSFYLKDIPAMGNPNYTIDENLTAEKGKEFLEALTVDQAKLITDIVEIQRDNLNAIVEKRNEISVKLREFLNGSTVNKDLLISLVEEYGRLDGEIVYHYAKRFTEVYNTLSDSQKIELMQLRDLDDYSCTGAYLYSERISMINIVNTDFLFN